MGKTAPRNILQNIRIIKKIILYLHYKQIILKMEERFNYNNYIHKTTFGDVLLSGVYNC